MLISVWGSTGTGKSLFSTILGKSLAEAGKKTLIVYAGLQSNDTSCFYPEESEITSMGNLWQTDLEDEEMLRYMMTTENDNLAYLSYAPGENIYSYPIFTKFNIVNVFSKLSSFFEYIIVDCSSDLNGSVITLTALEMADRVIRLMGASGKDYMYFVANLQIISDSRFNLDNHICVLSDIKKGEPSEVYEKKYGGISYHLYHETVIYAAYLEGSLFKSIKSPYVDTVKKIISDNIYDEILSKDKKKKANRTVKKGKDRQGEKTKTKKSIFFRKEDVDGRYDD